MVRAGYLADLVMVDQNPLDDFKVLYGTGTIRINDTTGSAERVGGVKYVMKDGIVYDAKQLLRDVEAIGWSAELGWQVVETLRALGGAEALRAEQELLARRGGAGASS